MVFLTHARPYAAEKLTFLLDTMKKQPEVAALQRAGMGRLARSAARLVATGTHEPLGISGTAVADDLFQHTSVAYRARQLVDAMVTHHPSNRAVQQRGCRTFVGLMTLRMDQHLVKLAGDSTLLESAFPMETVGNGETCSRNNLLHMFDDMSECSAEDQAETASDDAWAFESCDAGSATSGDEEAPLFGLQPSSDGGGAAASAVTPQFEFAHDGRNDTARNTSESGGVDAQSLPFSTTNVDDSDSGDLASKPHSLTAWSQMEGGQMEAQALTSDNDDLTDDELPPLLGTAQIVDNAAEHSGTALEQAVTWRQGTDVSRVRVSMLDALCRGMQPNDAMATYMSNYGYLESQVKSKMSGDAHGWSEVVQLIQAEGSEFGPIRSTVAMLGHLMLQSTLAPEQVLAVMHAMRERFPHRLDAEIDQLRVKANIQDAGECERLQTMHSKEACTTEDGSVTECKTPPDLSTDVFVLGQHLIQREEAMNKLMADCILRRFFDTAYGGHTMLHVALALLKMDNTVITPEALRLFAGLMVDMAGNATALTALDAHLENATHSVLGETAFEDRTTPSAASKLSDSAEYQRQALRALKAFLGVDTTDVASSADDGVAESSQCTAGDDDDAASILECRVSSRIGREVHDRLSGALKSDTRPWSSAPWATVCHGLKCHEDDPV
jgi:hypothetical protein